MTFYNADISAEEVEAFKVAFHNSRDNQTNYDDSVKIGMAAAYKVRGVTRSITEFGVLILTTAYESGVGDGIENGNKVNPYPVNTAEYFAWTHGYQQGQNQSTIMELDEVKVHAFFESRNYSAVVNLLQMLSQFKAMSGTNPDNVLGNMGNSAAVLLETLVNFELKSETIAKAIGETAVSSFGITADDLVLDGEDKTHKMTKPELDAAINGLNSNPFHSEGESNGSEGN
jgi:hypothetical protein